MLYKDNAGWHILDFKTDEVREQEGLSAALDEYRPQIHRYKRAAGKLLGEKVDAYLVMLDALGEVAIIN